MEQGAALFGRATFAMDRDYDDNKIFLKLDGLEQDYVIRLTSKRKLLYHGRWTPTTELRDRRKGKIKTSMFYKGKDHEAAMKPESSALKAAIIKATDPIHEQVAMSKTQQNKHL